MNGMKTVYERRVSELVKSTIWPTSFTGVKASVRLLPKTVRIFLRFVFAKTNMSAMKVRLAKSCR